MNVPGAYDPVTLNHWLWWKLRCHEGSPEDFQKLFEEVVKRAKPEFMQIRPYGNIGDRKCDGLYFQDGVVFQVYAPDQLKQSEVQAKIEDDLKYKLTYPLAKALPNGEAKKRRVRLGAATQPSVRGRAACSARWSQM